MTGLAGDLPYVAFADGNSIWHRRIGNALLDTCPGELLLPHAGFGAARTNVALAGGGCEVAVPLPRGWASRTAFIGQKLLARRILVSARRSGRPAVAVLTSPAYAPLARVLRGRVPIAYYCADDYREYRGWGGDIARSEAAILRHAGLGIFGSEALRERAVREYALAAERTMVSPNATEPRFVADRPAELPADIAALPRPIVGVLGGIGPRIDLAALAALARGLRSGTLLIVGPSGAGAQDAERLASLPRVHLTGEVPHDRIHLYARAIDIGFIPYARSEFNRHCSPMRLYDHLATGVPIFATDACDQVNRCRLGNLTVAPDEAIVPAVLAEVERIARGGAPRRASASELWSDRAAALIARLADIARPVA